MFANPGWHLSVSSLTTHAPVQPLSEKQRQPSPPEPDETYAVTNPEPHKETEKDPIKGKCFPRKKILPPVEYNISCHIDQISHTKEILSITRCPICTINFTVSIGYWLNSQVKWYGFDSYRVTWVFSCFGFHSHGINASSVATRAQRLLILHRRE
jgi:hypothetical protein